MKVTFTLFIACFFSATFVLANTGNTTPHENDNTSAQPLPLATCDLILVSVVPNPEPVGQLCEGSATYTFTINCSDPFDYWEIDVLAYQSSPLISQWTSTTNTLEVVIGAPLDPVNSYKFNALVYVDGFEIAGDTMTIRNIPTLGCSDLDFSVEQIHGATDELTPNGEVRVTIFTSACGDEEWTAGMQNLETSEEYAVGHSNSIHNSPFEPDNTSNIIYGLPAGNYAVFVQTDYCPLITGLFVVDECAIEIMCNELDDNCNGLIDEGFEDEMETFYIDQDGDLYGNPLLHQNACTAPTGYVSNGTDCDDVQSSTHPGAIEIVGNLIDDNCNGEIDETTPLTRYYADYDFDGYGNAAIFIDVPTGENPANFVLDGTDCDDTNPDMHPQADQGVLEWTTTTLAVHESVLPANHYCVYGNNFSSTNSDGGYLDFPRSNNCDEMFVTKIDNTGDIVWQSEVEFDLPYEYATSHAYYGAATHDGGGILVGTDYTLLNYRVAKAVKLDALGNTQWKFQSGHSLNASGSTDLQYISETSDGGFIGAGVDQQFNFALPPYVFSGVYIVKISAYGVEEWHKILSNYSPLSSIIQTPDGGYIGVSAGNTYINDYSSGKLLTKFDASGNIVWAKEDFAASTTEQLETQQIELQQLEAGSIAIATDGNILVGVGRYSYSPATFGNRWEKVLLKYDNAGNEIWRTVVEDATNHATFTTIASNITVYETGNFLFDDYYNIIKFDTDGNNLGKFQIDSVNYYAASADGGVITSFNNNPDPTKIQKYSGKEVFDICDHVDNDCDGLVDEDATSFTYYLDTDNDGYGSIETSVEDCEVPLPGYSRNALDCNDHDFEVNPNAEEICNHIDDNCNGLIDDGVIDATITPSGSVSACVGSAVLLSVPDKSGLLYTWKKNNVNITGAHNHDYVATESGNYKVLITVQVGGCKATSSTVKVTINPTPLAEVTALTDLNLCGVNDRVRLKATAGAGYSYAWLLNGFYAPNNYSSRTYSAKNAGSYTVVVTNAQGCSRTSNAVAVAVGCKEGIAEGDHNLSIYPNPTDQNFTIDLVLDNELNTTAQITIYNTTGQLIYSTQKAVLSGMLFEEIRPENNLPDGMYAVQIIVDEKIYQQNLVVIH